MELHTRVEKQRNCNIEDYVTRNEFGNRIIQMRESSLVEATKTPEIVGVTKSRMK